jgi:uncharacterized protein YuzE
MRLTYDAEADAAYLYFAQGEPVARTVPGEGEADGVNLDFNEAGVLIGVEVLEASRRLPQDALDQAESD